MTKTQFFTTSRGPDAGIAYLEGAYADMAAYPPKGLGQKFGFRVFEPASGETPEDLARRLLTEPGSPVAELHAPAGCIPLGNGEYLFFGSVRPALKASACRSGSEVVQMA